MPRILLALGAFALLSLPISYAVIADARAAERIELLRESLERTARHPMEGVGRVEFASDSDEGERRLGVRAAFRRGASQSSVQVLEAVKNGEPVVKRPERYRWLVAGRAIGRFIRDFDLTMRNYRLVEGPRETAAGRACLRLELVSRSTAETAATLWIDPVDRIVVRRRSVSVGRSSLAEFESVSLLDESPKPQEERGGSRRSGPRSVDLFPGAKLTLRDADAIDPGFDPVRIDELPHGFVLRSAKGVEIDVQAPVVVRATAVLRSYSDGIHHFSVMQMRTADFEKLRELVRALRSTGSGAIVGHMSRARGSGDLLFRDGGLPYASRGETTLVAAGSVGREEIAFLLARFLD